MKVVRELGLDEDQLRADMEAPEVDAKLLGKKVSINT